MKAICDGCGHDWEMPESFVARLHPPRKAVRLMSACGCERCVENFDGGPFYWRMEDGTTATALAGEDELEEQGVEILAHRRIRNRVR